MCNHITHPIYNGISIRIIASYTLPMEQASVNLLFEDIIKYLFGKADCSCSAKSLYEGARRAGRIIFKSAIIKIAIAVIPVNKSGNFGWANAWSRPESARTCVTPLSARKL